MRPHRNSRGAVTFELVVLMPVLLVISLGGVHAALLFHARTIAAAAAQNGAREAAAEDGSLGGGIATATAFTRVAGETTLSNVRVDGDRSRTSVTITVHASSISLVPGLPTDATSSATLPVERLTR